MSDLFQKEIFNFIYNPSPNSEQIMDVSDQMGMIYSKEFYLKRKYFNNHLILYVLDGIFHVKQYGKHFILHKGDCILMTLRDTHEYYTDPQDTARVIWFHFRGYATESIMAHLKAHNQLPIISSSVNIDCDFTQLFTIRKNCSQNFEYRIAPLIHQIVLSVACTNLMNINLTEENSFTNNVLLYIKNHITEKITIEDLSNYLGYRKCYFLKIFPNSFNLPPHQLILQTKLQHAAQLLLETDLSIAEISNTYAFTDQSHFGKSFKRFYGISPLRYRNIHRT